MLLVDYILKRACKLKFYEVNIERLKTNFAEAHWFNNGNAKQILAKIVV